MLINCPDCNSEVSDLASACPRCARPIAVRILLTERHSATIKRADEKSWRSVPEPRRNAYVRNATWSLAALTVAGVVIGAIYSGSSTPVQAVETKLDHQSTTNKANDHCSKQKYESDRLQMELAFGRGILKNDEEGSELGVFVSERYWNQMTFKEKTQFAEALSCAASGVGKEIAETKFRSDVTGKTIGEWSWGRFTVP
jgi:hypothetical protein